MMNYYLERMFVGKHYGPYLCLKHEVHIDIGEILALHRISVQMLSAAFFYLNLFRYGLNANLGAGVLAEMSLPFAPAP